MNELTLLRRLLALDVGSHLIPFLAHDGATAALYDLFCYELGSRCLTLSSSVHHALVTKMRYFACLKATHIMAARRVCYVAMLSFLLDGNPSMISKSLPATEEYLFYAWLDKNMVLPGQLGVQVLTLKLHVLLHKLAEQCAEFPVKLLTALDDYLPRHATLHVLS